MRRVTTIVVMKEVEYTRINTSKVILILAEKGMTRSELAIVSGICRQNISTILTRGTCSPKTAGKIAQGLGIPVAEIMKEE